MVDAYSEVTEHFELPFEFRTYQVDTLNDLAPRPRAGYYLPTGTGKTAVSTAAALYKMLKSSTRLQAIVAMPPILVPGWGRWLKKIKGRHRNVTFIEYRGTPRERREMKLDADFILMSMEIFKRDFERLTKAFAGKDVILMVDEATSIKNVGTSNHKKVNEFSAGRDLMLLTGTPISKPGDGYAYVKLVAPGTYRNLNHFENIHVAERDFFDNVVAWQNLDLLKSNMQINAVQLIKEECLPDLPPVSYIPSHYRLDKEHYALYRKLADEQLLKLKDGGKIDATQANTLFHALQQIVINYDYFAQTEGHRSAGMDLLDQVLEETPGEKLVVVASYKLTNRMLETYLKKHNARSVYGDIPPAKQQAAIATFIEDPSCRVLCIQPRSAGFGVDGLQHVCSNMLFLETPTVPMWFHQTVDRLKRDGQRFNTRVWIGIAEKTIQVRLHEQLLNADELVNQVVPTWKDLRDAIYGE